MKVVLLRDLRALVADNSEPNQLLDFYDDTPDLDDDRPTWFIDSDYRYTMRLLKPRLLSKIASIYIQRDEENGEHITRERFLDFLDSMIATGYSTEQDVGLVFDNPYNPRHRVRYLTGFWSKVEAVVPGEFALLHGEDATSVLVHLDEMLDESTKCNA